MWLGFGILLWVWIGGVLWVVVQVGGFPSCHVVGCSYSGVDTEGVEVKIPFDKRPKTRVQGVVDLCFMWCCYVVLGFFLLQVRFGRGGVFVE